VIERIDPRKDVDGPLEGVAALVTATPLRPSRCSAFGAARPPRRAVEGRRRVIGTMLVGKPFADLGAMRP
jgi:hypothetical protein